MTSVLLRRQPKAECASGCHTLARGPCENIFRRLDEPGSLPQFRETQLMSTDAILITTTVADRADAERIAAALVAKRLVACVQVSGPVESTFQWKGQVETSQEWVCAAKTRKDRYLEVEQAIRELHSYEQPEIVAVPIVLGSLGYLTWISEVVPAPRS